jgi:hypothetical protein
MPTKVPVLLLPSQYLPLNPASQAIATTPSDANLAT